MKETLPQYCCMVRALERAHQAAARQYLEQIYHSICNKRNMHIEKECNVIIDNDVTE
jgi:hypothetical protein